MFQGKFTSAMVFYKEVSSDSGSSYQKEITNERGDDKLKRICGFLNREK